MNIIPIIEDEDNDNVDTQSNKEEEEEGGSTTCNHHTNDEKNMKFVLGRWFKGEDSKHTLYYASLLMWSIITILIIGISCFLATLQSKTGLFFFLILSIVVMVIMTHLLIFSAIESFQMTIIMKKGYTPLVKSDGPVDNDDGNKCMSSSSSLSTILTI